MAGRVDAAARRPRAWRSAMQQRVSLITLGVADVAACARLLRAPRLDLRERQRGAGRRVLPGRRHGGRAVGPRRARRRTARSSDAAAGAASRSPTTSRSPEEVDAVIAEARPPARRSAGPGRRRSGAATRASSSTPTATRGRSATTRTGRSPRTARSTSAERRGADSLRACPTARRRTAASRAPRAARDRTGDGGRAHLGRSH